MTRAAFALKKRWPLIAGLLALAASLPAVSLAAEPAAEPAAGNRWEKEIRAFEAQDQLRPPPKDATLFVGSSSIRLWQLDESFPEIKTINRGFGGSQLADSVEFAERIVIPYRPKWIVLYAGDNDLAGGKTPERVLGDFKAFAAKVHKALPDTQIAFISIKPSPSRWKLAARIRETNARIAEFIAGDKRLHFVDVFAPMLDPDGQPRKELFREDGLHLNAEGYRLWASAVRAALAGQ